MIGGKYVIKTIKEMLTNNKLELAIILLAGIIIAVSLYPIGLNAAIKHTLQIPRNLYPHQVITILTYLSTSYFLYYVQVIFFISMFSVAVFGLKKHYTSRAE